MSLLVKAKGAWDLIVDEGRFGQRHQGLPWSGPADADSYHLANALLGNPANCPALEISLSGPVLHAQCDLALGLFGAPFPALIDGAPLTRQGSFTLKKNQTLELQACKTGMRAYLAVPEGFQQLPVLDSHSSLAPLKKGEALNCKKGSIPRRFLPQEWAWQPDSTPLRVLAGPESACFPLNELANQQFTVQPASNRMGLRLGGKPFTLNGLEMLSEPVCPGTVQVARDGQLLVLGVDGQTIGGYPRVAQVIRADLPRLGQLRPGDSITFSLVTLDEAEQTALDKNRRWEIISLHLHTLAAGFF